MSNRCLTCFCPIPGPIEQGSGCSVIQPAVCSMICWNQADRVDKNTLAIRHFCLYDGCGKPIISKYHCLEHHVITNGKWCVVCKSLLKSDHDRYPVCSVKCVNSMLMKMRVDFSQLTEELQRSTLLIPFFTESNSSGGDIEDSIEDSIEGPLDGSGPSSGQTSSRIVRRTETEAQLGKPQRPGLRNEMFSPASIAARLSSNDKFSFAALPTGPPRAIPSPGWLPTFGQPTGSSTGAVSTTHTLTSVPVESQIPRGCIPRGLSGSQGSQGSQSVLSPPIGPELNEALEYLRTARTSITQLESRLAAAESILARVSSQESAKDRYIEALRRRVNDLSSSLRMYERHNGSGRTPY